MNQLSGYEIRTMKKKKRIVDAARTLFFQNGPENSSIAKIASTAEVSQASIYNYFESKDRLVELVIREYLDSSIGKAEAILDLDIPFKEKVQRFFSKGEENQTEVDDQLLAKFNWQSPLIQSIYSKFVEERQVPFLIGFIERGKSEGAINQELSIDAVLAYFNANMAIYKDPNFLNKGKKYIASLSQLFFYGLLER